MTIIVEQGDKTGTTIVRSDKGLCVAVADGTHSFADIFNDLQLSMKKANAPSGSIACKTKTLTPDDSVRRQFADAGVSITRGKEGLSLTESALEKVRDFEKRLTAFRL